MGREQDLDALDDLLLGVRRLTQRPGYRRRLLAGLDVDVSPGVIRVVRMVSLLSEGSPSLGETATGLGIDASTTSRLVDGAVAAGFLVRRQSPDDLRRTLLQLTPAGSGLLHQADQVRRRLLSEVVGDWDEGDLHHLVTLMERLRADLSHIEA